MGKLDGRVVIVTGSGRGIGASLARAMAREGASVVVNDIGANLDGSGKDATPAQGVVDEITAAGGKAVANYDDVSDYNAAENIVRTALDTYGRLDVLVNVAGILRDRMVFNMTEEEWDAVIRVHLKGTFNTTKYASLYWRQAREGHYRLINFTSVSGIYGAPGQPNYAAAKMGIVGLTYSCANALARYGVTANAISPAAATRMTESIPVARRPDAPAESADEAAERRRQEERAPENVAPAVIYLASTRSDWITGRIVGAQGYEISLLSNPDVVTQVASNGPWNLDDAFDRIEQVFRPAIEGYDMHSKGRVVHSPETSANT